MTIAPITDIPAVASVKGAAVKNNNGGEENGFSFTDAMKMAGDNKADQTLNDKDKRPVNAGTQTIKQGSVLKSDNAGADKEVSAADNKKTENTDKTDKAGKTDDKVKEEAGEKVDEVTDKVVDKISEETGFSEEEIQEAMETLGLTVADLLDPAKMARLLNALNGQTDAAFIISDEGMFDTVNKLIADVSEIVNDAASEIAKEFDISLDEAQDLLKNAFSDKIEAADAVIKEPVISDEVTFTDEAPVNEAAEVVNSGSQAIVYEDDEPVAKTAENTERAIVNETVRVTAPEKNENAGAAKSEDNGAFNDNAAAANVNNGPVNNETPIAANEVPFEGYTSNVDGEDILNQITEHVRVNNSEGLTEMDIALNPASLGNIHIHLTSREGVITATIGAANDSVREALMLQAITLKEELNEQGLKVDAIEVTVASHEFEQQMDGNANDQAKDMMEREISKGQRRRLVLNGLNEVEDIEGDGELTDEEKLQVDMMRQSGQTVDFTA